MFLLDGKRLGLDMPFEHDGMQYPANWLRLASAEDRAAIGITEVDEQPRPDDRFYWVSDMNDDGSYSAVPKDLANLKSEWSDRFKQMAYTMLAPSDWLVVRKQENGTAIPAEWTKYRESVRSTCALAITDLNSKADLDAFIASVTAVQWPESPDRRGMGI